MKPNYIKQFEKMGFGIFVHFGLYSLIGKGEWHYWSGKDANKEKYFTDEFADKFSPKKDWAIKLVKYAKKIGARYITITTKHHEGFFLYDSKGLTTWDSVHHGPKRDYIAEFVDACNKEGIVPFFYHALLDWHNKEYTSDFPKYIDFLVKSIEILCKNYGKIGGFWFDGFWDKPNENWQFDRLYSTIRKYQPEALIINNTGLSDTGKVGHYEIDSVTFERGKPRLVSSEDGKERAGEMCEVFGEHWGYTKNDINYKPISKIITTLVECRYYNCNLLLNVGPKGNGYIKDIDRCYLDALGMWIKNNKYFIYNVRKADIELENALCLFDGKSYYAFIDHVPMAADINVQLNPNILKVNLHNHKVKKAVYLDTGKKVAIVDNGNAMLVEPFDYGKALCSRVVKFDVKQ